MCVFGLGALASALTGGAGAATATGAAASAGSAMSIGQILQVGGTLASVAGQVSQGMATRAAAEMNVEQIERQKRTEAQLSAVREQRARAQFKSAMATQRAQIAGSGVSLGSPTAVLLGQNAAREMIFEAQAIRSGGQATQAELTGQQAVLRAQGTNALFKGGFGAAGTLLNATPKIWPELLA